MNFSIFRVRLISVRFAETQILGNLRRLLQANLLHIMTSKTEGAAVVFDAEEEGVFTAMGVMAACTLDLFIEDLHALGIRACP